jgi:uncharacterized surface protein with fasciclin (FAS1) repeats
MMNKLLLLLLIIFNSSLAFAQKTDSTAIKPIKAKNVNGSIMSPSKTIQENIAASPDFSTLKYIIVADTTNTLSGNPITVFAPDNQAFSRLPVGTIDTLLLPTHKSDLINLIKYHAIAGKVTSSDIERQIKAGNGLAKFTTLSGKTLTAKINENRNIVLTDENGDQSIISRLDVQQSNGILFVVTQVLLPKFTQ